MKDALLQLGFSDTEAQIYLQLLKRGAQTAVELAKEIRIHRRTIYDNLNILTNKGLVTYYTEGGVRLFKVNNPRMLERMVAQQQEAVSRVLPTLEAWYSDHKSPPQVSLLKGADASRALMQEMIDCGSEILWMGGGFRILDVLNTDKKAFLSELDGLQLRVLQAETANEEFREYLKQSPVRFVPAPYETGSSFFVYADTVIIGTIVQDDVYAIKMGGADIAAAYRNYFELIWRQGTPQ